MVDDGRTTDGRRTDGRTTEHGYTISSPCEPDGSGELKKQFHVACFAAYLSREKLYLDIIRSKISLHLNLRV